MEFWILSKLKLSPQKGFTLIEVMVALMIVAIALSAVSRSLGVTVSNQSHIEEKVIATWVAQNAIAEQQLQLRTKDFPYAEEMLNQEWQVARKIEPTFIPEVYRMSIDISQGAKENRIMQLHSIVEAP